MTRPMMTITAQLGDDPHYYTGRETIRVAPGGTVYKWCVFIRTPRAGTYLRHAEDWESVLRIDGKPPLRLSKEDRRAVKRAIYKALDECAHIAPNETATLEDPCPFGESV